MHATLYPPKTVAETFAAIGTHVSPTTVRRWIVDGKLGSLRVGARLFVSLDNLGDFIRESNSTETLRIVADRLRAAGQGTLADHLLATEGANHENSAA